MKANHRKKAHFNYVITRLQAESTHLARADWRWVEARWLWVWVCMSVWCVLPMLAMTVTLCCLHCDWTRTRMRTCDWRCWPGSRTSDPASKGDTQTLLPDNQFCCRGLNVSMVFFFLCETKLQLWQVAILESSCHTWTFSIPIPTLRHPPPPIDVVKI